MEADKEAVEAPAPAGASKPPAPRSVAIVAMGSSRSDYISMAINRHSRFGVADEIWAINSMLGIIQWDKGFMVDPYDEMPAPYMDTFKSASPGKPIFTSKTNPAYPNLVEYPVEEVVNSLGGLPYLNTSVAYALAYALYLGVKEIWLFGCDFCYPDVYKAEAGRACVEAWIMHGLMKGHNIHICNSSTLFDTSLGMPLYAFKDKYTVERLPSGRVQLKRKETPQNEPSAG